MVLRWLLSHQVGSKGACSSLSAINSAALQLNKSQVQTRGRLSRQAAGCSPSTVLLDFPIWADFISSSPFYRKSKLLRKS